MVIQGKVFPEEEDFFKPWEVMPNGGTPNWLKYIPNIRTGDLAPGVEEP